jgi:hypothetical protein
MTDVRRDNTGTGRYEEGLALPTTAFPSDHAVVSAAVRLRPVASAAPAASDEGVVGDEAKAEVSGDARPGRGGGTLFDYWGIAELPPSLSHVTDSTAVGTAVSAGAVEDAATQPLRARRPGPALASLERRVCGTRDRAVWVLFSPRPLSAALCQPWFIAIFAALAAAPLLDSLACCRSVLYPPLQPAGRAFRFTPVDPRHVFIPFDDAIRGGSGGLQQSTGDANLGGALLAAGSARLLLGGKDAPGAAAAQLGVSADGALEMLLPGGQSASADGLACDAERYPDDTAVALKVRERLY